jgi:hypothetical protein
MWKRAERDLARKGEPLAPEPRWWRPVRCARLLMSPGALVVEGREMDHCVASYVPAVKNKHVVIVALNVIGYRSTAEIDRQKVEVLQHKGKGNAAPPELCVRALKVLQIRWEAVRGRHINAVALSIDHTEVNP